MQRVRKTVCAQMLVVTADYKISQQRRRLFFYFIDQMVLTPLTHTFSSPLVLLRTLPCHQVLLILPHVCSPLLQPENPSSPTAGMVA